MERARSSALGRLGAALAFYTILSLAPLVILVIALVALIFGHSTAQDQLLGQLDSVIGHQGAEAVKGMIEHAQQPASGAFSSIIGVITLPIWSFRCIRRAALGA